MAEMTARGRWSPAFRTRLDDGRGHTVEIDLPEDEGGSDQGTSSLELTVLSLAGCVSTIFAFVARRRRLNYVDFDIELHAERPPRAPTISRVTGEVRVTSYASQEEIATAVALTLRTCPVGVLFERAGVSVEIHAVKVPPPSPRASEAAEPAAPLVVG